MTKDTHACDNNSASCTTRSVREACEFLADYAVLLFGSGSTAARLDKNMTRIARAFGMQLSFSVLPQHIHITLRDGKETYTSVATIRQLPISFAKISTLSKLSWQISDHRVSLECASEMLNRIRHERVINPVELMILVSAANAAFCRLFNGDPIAMAIVFVATLVGFYLKLFMARRHVDARIIVFVCAFVSTMIAALDGYFSLGTTPGIAIGTSVLYLIPGIPLINSFCDLIAKHYLCCIGRAIHAFVLLFCISAGLGLGMFLMHVAMFN